MSADILKNGHVPEWDPRALIELSGIYWKAGVLHAGVKLGVFTAIGKEPQTSEDIARKLGADRKAMFMLLNALSAAGLLVKAGQLYSNTPVGITYLSKDSDQYIGYMIMHHHGLMDSWIQLDKAVKNGGPLRTGVARINEEERENFLLGMFNIAMNLAPRLAEEIDLSDRAHLLDLGGGPGTFAVHFCLKNTGLKATVCDLPATKPFAEKIIKRFGLTDRIDFRAVDFLRDDIPGAYDAAWLSHILHGEGPQGCQTIIRKAVSALKPAGKIIVHDFILNDSMDGPLFPALFSLNMLLGTDSGQAYSQKQIMDMLASAGVKKIKRDHFKSLVDSGIISGVV